MNPLAQKIVERVIIGAALTMAASVLLPIAKKAIPALVQTGRSEMGGLAQRTKSMIQMAREEVEDIVAEAQFERMKRSLDAEILEGDGRGYDSESRGTT